MTTIMTTKPSIRDNPFFVFMVHSSSDIHQKIEVKYTPTQSITARTSKGSLRAALP